MNVLGIETSCDETAASVVKDGRKILSNVISSSLKLHQKYGGVVPEIASRKQLETIVQVVDTAISEARIKLKDINLVSVTSSPGLLGSLFVGISFAKSVSLALKIPLLGINHLHSHIYASFLQNQRRKPRMNIKFPFVALIISGGHTSLFYLDDFHQIKLLGSTQDDACGEAFDKVAKILGLGYPGGPLIESLAKKGDPKKIKFGCSGTPEALDFSFSGIKTAVLYKIKNQKSKIKNSLGEFRRISIPDLRRQDIAASFQEVVIDTLIKKSLLACRMRKVKILVVGGGVAANNRLREKFYQEIEKKGIKCYFPSPPLCLDNAAMVAGLGYQLFKKGYRSDSTF